MKKTWIQILITVLALLLCLLLVSMPFPIASAESLQDVVPEYVPVLLMAEEVTPLPLNEATPYEPHADGFLPDRAGYLDNTISVRVEEFRWFNTNIQVTWVQIADASQLRSASAARFPSKKEEKADVLARKSKAVLAINGDYIVFMNTGFSARNGVVLRERQGDRDAHNFDVLMVDMNGDFTIIQGMNRENIAAYRADHTIMHAFTFGPALVVNHEKNEYYPVRTHVPTHRTQRMGIGQMGPLSYVIVTTEGPDDRNSTGLTMTEMADVFMALGAENAYNLDGGSSSWLVLNYKRINGLHGSKHRAIADIIYFATAEPEGGAD